MTDIRHIPEQVVEGRRLGRHVAHDPRSRDFPAETAAQIKSVVHQAVGLPLDQGDLGSCTANALVGALNSTPDYAGVTRSEQDALKLYERETELEGEPYPPNDPGGTGLYVCRAAKQLGWIRYYHHAFGLDHALRALVIRPQIWGVNWYSGFDSPDPVTGVCKLSGWVRGGHEIVALELDTDRQLIGFEQSWGRWGLNGTGRFYVSFADADRLLREDGDVTVPYV